MPFSFTPVDLERELVQLIASATGDMLFKSPQDTKGQFPPVGLSVYQGHIPSYQAGPRSEAQIPKAPAVAIKTDSFVYRRLDGVCAIKFLIVTWDNNNSRRGYIDVLNVMNRIMNALEETVVIGQSFVLTDDPIHGELIDEPSVDYHPYYCGYMQAKFGLMTPSSGWDLVTGHTVLAPYGDTGADTLSIVAPEPLPE